MSLSLRVSYFLSKASITSFSPALSSSESLSLWCSNKVDARLPSQSSLLLVAWTIFSCLMTSRDWNKNSDNPPDYISDMTSEPLDAMIQGGLWTRPGFLNPSGFCISPYLAFAAGWQELRPGDLAGFPPQSFSLLWREQGLWQSKEWCKEYTRLKTEFHLYKICQKGKETFSWFICSSGFFLPDSSHCLRSFARVSSSTWIVLRSMDSYLFSSFNTEGSSKFCKKQ